MIQRFVLYSAILLSCSFAYDFTTDYLKLHPQCSAGTGQQSPVNIDIINTKYYDERNFRLIASNYTIYQNSTWTSFPDSFGVGFQGNFGSVSLVKNWALFNYNLNQVIFRVKSSHSFNGNFYDGEVQLIHKFDEDYRTPGRYLKENSKYLVISLFLKAVAVQDELNKTISNVLSDLNVQLASTSQNLKTINPTRRVKLNRIVQHSNQVIYDGKLPYGDCEDAIFLIDPRYQYIRQAELDSLTNLIKGQGYLNSGQTSNSRPIQPASTSTVFYRNTDSKDSYIIEPSIFQYDSSVLFSSIMWFWASIAAVFFL